MLISKDIYNRIDEIVDVAYLGFLFSMIGEDFLSDSQKRQLEVLGLIIGRRPLIELLYILIRNRPAAGYANDASLQLLLDRVSSTGILPVLNDSQQATIDDAKIAFMDSIEATKADLKKNIRQQITKINKEYKRDVTVKRYTSVPKEQQKQIDYTGLLLGALTGLSLGAKNNFRRSFVTNLTDYVNDSVLDQATSDAIMTGIPSEDVKVFKEVVNDGSLCQWCRKFYSHKDGSPIVYSLAELQANGSNQGKPKSAWKPVIGATHPHCRCQLHHAR